MTTSLYESAGRFASSLAKEDASAGERWQVLLGTSIYGQSAPPNIDSFMPILSDSVTLGIAVLRSALRPFLELKRGWGVEQVDEEREDRPDAMVTWNSNEHKLTKHILHIVQESDARDRSLHSALEGAMIAAYDLLDAYHGKSSWDSISRHRSAIEPHAQDRFRTPLDAIIDGLREYGIKALPLMPELPDQWWDHGRALMQRLALHLVANDPERNADDKLQWLLDRNEFYKSDLKHETYQVLFTAVGSASPSLKQRVLDVTADGPNYAGDASDHKRDQAYAKYNLLAWLTQADPDWVEAQNAFDAIQAENPDFKVREHPDLNTWFTSGIRRWCPPMGIEEFGQAVAGNAQSALNDLLSHDYSGWDFDQPCWEDALRLVQQTVEQYPDLGVRLWDVLDRGEFNSKQVDLQYVIAEGWGKAQLRDSDLEVVKRLTTLLKVKGAARSIGSFLLNQICQQHDLDESPLLASMRDMALALWREQGKNFTYQKDLTPLSGAPLYLNSWPGLLAQYWGYEVDRRWRHSGEEWAGLSDEESEALLALLNGNKDALDATQPAIAGNLFFYFAADSAFSKEHLLPLFNDPQRHAFAWDPFLHHRRWNDRLLEAGLFESMIEELDRLDKLPEQQLQGVFLGLVTSVVSYAGITDSDRRRLLDKTVIALDGSLAGEFAQEVVRFVNDDDIDGAEVWCQWLREHLERRLTGLPRIAPAEELVRWADVVPLVGEHIPEAVKLFSGPSIGLSAEFIEPEFRDGALTSYGAELVAFFAERIRNTVDFDYMIRYRAEQLVQAIRDVLGDAVAQPLLEAAEEKGFLGIGE